MDFFVSDFNRFLSGNRFKSVFTLLSILIINIDDKLSSPVERKGHNFSSVCGFLMFRSYEIVSKSILSEYSKVRTPI